ncbi:TPA: YoaK family small membrane protein [Escherichia fergusonii]|nr:YoaK family small membrane protein [Escherichia fergusonii]EFL4509758.1 YoaK family small membrane protein [Escherichia fergusonii]EFL4514098.1 YoaK family small membrane protein [Escherichia fergusonii]EFN0217858.1 YoaK family small membrane protein [Escherichia fergusonii]EFO7693633.1 YoaK family small membrane protein [Escherichia fergusonii]EHM5089877.1 YoaK family small membrane protein [Escherichia fergusonii]
MRIGIMFPVVIFITANVFLAWFFIGGYATPGA